MKVADLSVEELQKTIGATLQTVLPPLFIQSETRVIELLCDRMDEGFAEIRQEMSAGFSDVYAKFDDVHERFAKLERRTV